MAWFHLRRSGPSGEAYPYYATDTATRAALIEVSLAKEGTPGCEGLVFRNLGAHAITAGDPMPAVPDPEEPR